MYSKIWVSYYFTKKGRVNFLEGVGRQLAIPTLKNMYLQIQGVKIKTTLNLKLYFFIFFS